MDHLKVFTERVIIEGLPCGSVVRICLPMQETQVRSLHWGDLLEKEMATHSSILPWKIPWTEEPGGPQFIRMQKESDMT